jgi:hypothetical protein
LINIRIEDVISLLHYNSLSSEIYFDIGLLTLNLLGKQDFMLFLQLIAQASIYSTTIGA